MRIGYLKRSHRKTGLLHDFNTNGGRKRSFVSAPRCAPSDDRGKYDDIENLKNEADLKNFYLRYNKKEATELLRDYEILTSGTLKKKCSLAEVIECRKIFKYVVDTTSVVHFLRSKGGCYKSSGSLTTANESHQTSGPNNVYYIHNIEKPKVNRSELIRTSRNNRCMNALMNNNMHKFIYRLKKCDILNYKEKVISKEHVNYNSLLFPLTYVNLVKAKESEADSYFMDTNIFYHFIHRRNTKAFIEILKRVNYKILSAQEIRNGLLLLTILHHNNISMSNDKSNIVKCAGTSEVSYKNEDYVNKKMLQEIFMNLCQGIHSKLESISFLQLYDYLLLMCINEVKSKEVYAGILNRLSHYVNVINKISNDLNRSDATGGDPLCAETETVDGSASTIGSVMQSSHPREDPLGLQVESLDGAAPGWTNHSTIGAVNGEGDDIEAEDEEWAQNIAQSDDSRFYLRKDHRQHITNNLLSIKNILLHKVLLVYMTKYLFSHIDSNILYAHSDLICENLELMTHHMITNFIFTIGTCKHVDEFCMFMLAKYVQNYVHTYTPNEITIIVNTYADASLEDVSFYETICEHMKRNFETFSSIDIIKIIYAFSKVRIRDVELLKMAYEKINNYLEERERKMDDTCVQVKGPYVQWDSEKKKKKKNFNSHFNGNTVVPSGGLLDESDHRVASDNNVYEDKQIKRNVKRKKYVINKYLCAYALIAAGKLDYVEELDKLFVHLKNSIHSEGIDIRGVLWMPMAITSLLSSECIFHFLPIYVHLIYNAFKKTQSPKLLSLLIRRHSILLHTIETDIIPKKYISKGTLNNLYYICKTKKDNSKEKVFIPDSSTFHIEVSNALLSLDIAHKKEVNIYPFTIDIFISRPGDCTQKGGQSNNTQKDSRRAAAPLSYGTTNFSLDHIAREKKKIQPYDNDTNFEHTFETKKVKKKSKNKNEVYTDVPIA
ncbi:hypothetical protein AK88_02907 [Plasmodium fragile]|uniref:Uncharacterized protein n=1 Tax=Plasmodium fragile TaxID=5857 RepID=A0A0D9QK78_PLAFR|nr:uncharacterized protein AK88_02907 [Plasmodium fragile]KJP87475.1 hypothetical protein AK88_02907 [Plasmodium fragile]